MACARCRRATGCPVRLGGAGQGVVASAVSLMASWNRSALLTKNDDVASTARAVVSRLQRGCGGRSVVGLLFAQPMNGVAVVMPAVTSARRKMALVSAALGCERGWGRHAQRLDGRDQIAAARRESGCVCGRRR